MSYQQRSTAPIASSIDLLRRQLGLGRAGSVETLVGLWAELVGSDVAANSTVIDLRGGVLTVHAYDPATAELLKWSQQRILDGANEACPAESIGHVAIKVRRRG